MTSLSPQLPLSPRQSYGGEEHPLPLPMPLLLNNCRVQCWPFVRASRGSRAKGLAWLVLPASIDTRPGDNDVPEFRAGASDFRHLLPLATWLFGTPPEDRHLDRKPRPAQLLHQNALTAAQVAQQIFISFRTRMSSYTPDTDAAPPRQPPSMCMPNELLDEVFKHVFVELDDKPLRDRVRVYAPLSLVCKAWQRVAAPYPWTNVRLDVVEDLDVIACLDPVGGVGDRQLLLIKSLRLLASESLIQPAKKDEKEESGVGDEDEDGDSETPPARLSPILHGPANDETSSLPIVASVARILAKCSNLSV
ncbi:hypothetical protein C6P46_000801, partial [Rhodotorula mucilaginosa]